MFLLNFGVKSFIVYPIKCVIQGKVMSEEKHFIGTFKWLAYAILLYLVVDTFSKSYPEFRAYGVAIIGAFVVVAVIQIKRKAKIKVH